MSLKYNEIGKTGMKVARLAFGASSLGGVFHEINEKSFAVEGQTVSVLQLVGKERLAYSSHVRLRGHGIKQIGVLHIELFWFCQLAKSCLAVIEHGGEPCSLE